MVNKIVRRDFVFEFEFGVLVGGDVCKDGLWIIGNCFFEFLF